MRVITAVTVVFLPATFTAVNLPRHTLTASNLPLQTFFSTTFFNFGAGDDGKVYSVWLWLYFVLTLVLTAIVVGGTWILWRGKEKEITKEMGLRTSPRGFFQEKDA